MAEPTVRLGRRASALARKGHPWFFADDLDGGPPERAGLVRVRDRGGRDLGLGMTSPRSRIPVRLCGPWPGGAVPDRVAFFAARLDAALAGRAGAWGPRRGVRLVHGEADALPGLVVDAYDDVLVLQVTTPFVEDALDAIVPHLVERTGAAGVLARNDVPVREREGLPREVRVLHGRPRDPVTVEEDGLAHEVRPFHGHKTGFYLDQRPARRLVRGLGAGLGVLDLFAYQGAFALAALAGGAAGALAVDQSPEALERARRGAERNGLTGLEVEEGNAFDVLRRLRRDGRRYGVVVVDPPAFARSRREVQGALRGYRDLNRQALRLLAPGGHLVTCTCSHHVGLPMFEGLVRQAAAGLPFRVVLRGRLGAGPDHPVWIGAPETEYLKVLHLQRIDVDPAPGTPS